MVAAGSGLRDWFIQRVTAVWLLGYAVYLFIFFVRYPHLEFSQWQALFHCPWMQIGTVMTVTALTAHAWIGMWTVLTDYVRCSMIRLGATAGLVGWLGAQWVWTIMIVWGQ